MNVIEWQPLEFHVGVQRNCSAWSHLKIKSTLWTLKLWKCKNKSRKLKEFIRLSYDFPMKEPESFTILHCRPGYFYWETVLFQTTILKWDYFSKFSDFFYHHFSYKITWQLNYIYIHMYGIHIQLVSFQTLHTKKMWENETYFH